MLGLPASQASTSCWVASASVSPCSFKPVRLCEEGRLTGTVQATITRTERGRAAEVAWVVGTPWQRRGIATEAARGLIAWLQEKDVQVVRAHIHPDHRPSAAVAAAVGLAPTGHRHKGEIRWELPLTQSSADRP
ncbi:GNAT family N-acetyltransferase [Streptomyces sp. NPDC096176]|uniref:GNAT family N-acetyltransferase n=1 Tax=Streptomyces sp. NPDC096176 TaxID=3366079 RepID=UPI00380365DA